MPDENTDTNTPIEPAKPEGAEAVSPKVVEDAPSSGGALGGSPIEADPFLGNVDDEGQAPEEPSINDRKKPEAVINEAPLEEGMTQTPVNESLSETPVKPTQKDLWSRFLAVVQFRKRKRLERIMELASTKASITNDDVQKLLRVSHATATRYLLQLVKEGKLWQGGKFGSSVTYSKI